jgi:hypothetical protein
MHSSETAHSESHKLQITKYDWLAERSKEDPRADFSTDVIKRRIGGKRRDAVVTAARAHAMISPSEKWELIGLCGGFAAFNLVKRVSLIKKLARVFDVEHPKSGDLLNEFSVRVAIAADLSALGSLGCFKSRSA